jgi:hypothetical protein
MLVVSDPIARALLTHLITTGGPLFGAIVGLFTNTITITHTTVFADLVEATFAGYSRSATITWGTVFTNPSFFAEADGNTTQFNCTGSTTPETITGYFVVDGSSQLLYAENFDTPIPISGSGDAVVIVPQFTLASQQL